MQDIKIDTKKAAEVIIARRLHAIRDKVAGILGNQYHATMREYYPSIRRGCIETKLNPIGLASLMGQRLHAENKNPLPFMAACVQFSLDGKTI